jgi:hypothetical protein
LHGHMPEGYPNGRFRPALRCTRVAALRLRAYSLSMRPTFPFSRSLGPTFDQVE